MTTHQRISTALPHQYSLTSLDSTPLSLPLPLPSFLSRMLQSPLKVVLPPPSLLSSHTISTPKVLKNNKIYLKFYLTDTPQILTIALGLKSRHPLQTHLETFFSDSLSYGHPGHFESFFVLEPTCRRLLPSAAPASPAFCITDISLLCKSQFKHHLLRADLP